MAIAEGIAARLVFKVYGGDGSMISNAEANMATAPGQAGGKTLRRVSATLGLAKDTYRSNEKRTDRQVADMRHGGRRGQGNITGELSPETYFAFMEASHRDTGAVPVVLNKTTGTLTSIAAGGGNLLFGGGDPVVSGLGVGDIIRIAGAAASAVNGINYLITGFSGGGNRTVFVSPALPTFVADTGSWTVTRPGKVTMPPSSGFVKRKFGIEVAHDDLGSSRFFPEHRVTGYRLGMPVNGMNTFEASFLGRGMKVLDATSTPVFPYFTAPPAPTTTGVTGPMDGVLLLGGVQVGVVTGLNVAVALVADAPSVRSQKFTPDVFLGELGVTGDISAYLENFDLLKAFSDETELELLTTVYSDTSPNAEGLSIYLPRIKLSSGENPVEGDGGQMFNGQFQALKYQGSLPGRAQTSIRIHDTAA